MLYDIIIIVNTVIFVIVIVFFPFLTALSLSHSRALSLALVPSVLKGVPHFSGMHQMIPHSFFSLSLYTYLYVSGALPPPPPRVSLAPPTAKEADPDDKPEAEAEAGEQDPDDGRVTVFGQRIEDLATRLSISPTDLNTHIQQGDLPLALWEALAESEGKPLSEVKQLYKEDVARLKKKVEEAARKLKEQAREKRLRLIRYCTVCGSPTCSFRPIEIVVEEDAPAG